MIFKIGFDFKKSIMVFVIGLILANFSVFINDATILETAETFFGISDLSHIKEKTIFLIFVLAIQYFNANIISFNLDNYDYLAIRYNSKNNYFKSIIFNALINTFLFYIIALFSISVVSILYVRNLSFLNVFLLLKAFVVCSVVCLTQLWLLMKFKPEVTVWIILAGSVIYAFGSQFIDANMPEPFFGQVDIKSIILFICLIIVYIICRRKFFKEWNGYAN